MSLALDATERSPSPEGERDGVRGFRWYYRFSIVVGVTSLTPLPCPFLLQSAPHKRMTKIVTSIPRSAGCLNPQLPRQPSPRARLRNPRRSSLDVGHRMLGVLVRPISSFCIQPSSFPPCPSLANFPPGFAMLVPDRELSQLAARGMTRGARHLCRFSVRIKGKRRTRTERPDS